MNPHILLVSAGSPYRRILRLAGITEGLFVTREIHQEPPFRLPTGCSIRSPHPGSTRGIREDKTQLKPCRFIYLYTLASPESKKTFSSPNISYDWTQQQPSIEPTNPLGQCWVPPIVAFYNQQGLLRAYSAPGSSIRSPHPGPPQVFFQ